MTQLSVGHPVLAGLAWPSPERAETIIVPGYEQIEAARPPSSVRAHFHRRVGLSPEDYRAQFRAVPDLPS